MLDACVNDPWQAPSDHIYSSLPPYRSKLLIILVRLNAVNVSEDATMVFTLVLLNKLPHQLLIFSQSDYLIQIVATNSNTYWQTVQIQISWLLQKLTDLDLHCLQMQCISGFSRTSVNGHWQAPLDLIYSSLPPNNSKLPIVLCQRMMLIHLCLAFFKRDIGKQFRPRSDATAVSDQDLHFLH